MKGGGLKKSVYGRELDARGQMMMYFPFLQVFMKI
jgi:hypothetical protein